jgi:VanZ family protein
MVGRRFPTMALIGNLASATTLVCLAVTPSAPSVGVSDLGAHGLAYGLEAVLLHWVLVAWLRHPSAVLVACLGAFGLGLFTEVLQAMQPARMSALDDLLADLAGVLAAGVLLLAVRWGVRIFRELDVPEAGGLSGSEGPS